MSCSSVVPGDKRQSTGRCGLLPAAERALARPSCASAGAWRHCSGNTAVAIDAYRRYVAMSTDPGPELLLDVERVRSELARLSRESGSLGAVTVHERKGS